jgi:hypothetical protein
MCRRGPRWGVALSAVVAVLAGVLGVAPPALAAAPPRYHITASVALAAPQVVGTVTIDFTNSTPQPLDHLVLLLFPNRFAQPDARVDDVNRPYIWWREEFDPGGMTLHSVQADETPAETRPLSFPGLPEGCALEVRLPAPLLPGTATRITAQFETTVPRRYGAFGVAGDMLTALGGWYPSLAWVRNDGTWAVDTLPPAAEFNVELSVASDLSVLLNGQYFPAPSPQIQAHVGNVHDLTLIAATDLQREETVAGQTRILFFHRPERLASRLSFGPTPVEITLEALRDIVADRPATVPAPGPELVVVAAPLRWYLTAPGEGMVVISDRALKVVRVLRPFHERQIAEAVYAELLWPRLTARESPADAAWVREGLGDTLGRRYLAEQYPAERSTQDWIETFNIFAIVDRFETAPKIPFAETMFENVPEADPLHERITTYNNRLPPGHVVVGKLRQRLGDDAFRQVIDQCVDSPEAFRACSARVSGQDLSDFYAQWLQPYPKINYAFTDVRLDSAHEGGAFMSELGVRRETTRPIEEPVDVALRSIGGQTVLVRWDGHGDSAHLRVATPWHAWQAVIDPNRQLIETTRADNAHPPILQLVLDSAEVEVSSTEFGVSGLVVARRRYDYQQDLAVLGSWTNRSIGVGVGPRLHWGVRNDPNSYRNNLYGFYNVQALDAGFENKQQPGVRTAGHINGLGVRYDYNTIVSYDNPTQAVQARLFADWFDRALGSGYNYVDWGAGLVVTHPLWTHRTVLAGEIFNGFSEPLGASLVPNQGLFSLGGSLSIRGIGAEEELARNIFLLRAELRQSVYPEVDLNLFDTLVLRRAQVHVFVDSGQVANSAGAVYDPAGYAVGVGIGLGAVYEFMGFFPSTAYLELATQARGPGSASDVQVLFGTRQAF